MWSLIESLVDPALTPGVSAAIIDGAAVTTGVFGQAQVLPAPAPLHSGALYDLASLTKVLGTTTVFWQAVAKGSVTLDMPLAQWLPEFHEPTTFRQALTHTSGLVGYIPHRDELPARCVPTTYDPVHGLRQGLVHDPKSAILGVHSGAAGLFATLQDLIRFSQVLMTPTAYPWVPLATQVQDATQHGLGRAVGWDLRRDAGGHLWFYHTGYTGGFWLLQPQSRRALIVLANRVHPQVHPAYLPRRDALVTAFLRGQG